MDEDRPKGFNIKCTYITDDIRVSTGVFVSGHIMGIYGQVETFVFHPKGQPSPMKIHGTYPLHVGDDARAEIPEKLRDRAIKAHDRYVRYFNRRHSATAHEVTE